MSKLNTGSCYSETDAHKLFSKKETCLQTWKNPIFKNYPKRQEHHSGCSICIISSVYDLVRTITAVDGCACTN